MVVKNIYTTSDNVCLQVTDVNLELRLKAAEKIKTLSKLEKNWQKSLEEITGLRHEYIDFGWITDLSNCEVLIEIKRAENFREAIGQCLQYRKLKERKHGPIVCILVVFKAQWDESQKQLNIEICNDLNIHLVILADTELQDKNFQSVIKHLPISTKKYIEHRNHIRTFRMTDSD